MDRRTPHADDGHRCNAYDSGRVQRLPHTRALLLLRSLSGLGLSDFMLGRANTFRQGNPAVDRTLGLHTAVYFRTI